MNPVASYEEYKQVIDKIKSLTQSENKDAVHLYELDHLHNLATAYEQVKYDFTADFLNQQSANSQSNTGTNQPFQYFL
ncbi:hypothetical protein [Pedobacter paludis]|uniref:Uncharacterized protein n=1 Tax=Pedobacter paludis TaxID=2203212 RepID=A0A317F6K9_9SPHI|nr:hypothetical protein [Pedobacter paludis]PWS33158.1 hypothetical protein DF947_00535 [Pedobacter paludis]